MICSVSELALPEKQTEKGILVLGDAYETGEDFYKQYHERPVSASV
jgi:tRNA-binding protein